MTEITGGAVEKARGMRLESETGVTPTLCYGVQWDATLNFIDPNYITNETAEGNANCDETSYLRDSLGKGWYDNNIIGNTERKTGIDINNQKPNQVKNIYDMAGNVDEWTMEAYTNTYLPNRRIARGGESYSMRDVKPVSGRTPREPSVIAYSGFRPTLYIAI